jgi:hypothetical protein
MRARSPAFVAKGNYLHDGTSGHFIKTIAADNYIANNQIIDEHGTGTHLVDVWVCSATVVLGNVLVKTGSDGNLTFVSLTPRKRRGELIPCPEPEKKFAAIAYNTAVFTVPEPLWSTLVQHRHMVGSALGSDQQSGCACGAGDTDTGRPGASGACGRKCAS